MHEGAKAMPSRFDYVAYDETALKLQMDAKEAAQSLESKVNAIGPGRYTALALTALEEAYAWIGKSIRDGQIARNGSAPLQEARSKE